ncbi:MAG: DUF493 domain-containing protein [Spirochaetales bacterium]|nr:DUF493 domain-containing protein [Spirochaetales bacterium]
MIRPNIDNNPFGDTKVDYPARVAMKVITHSTYTIKDQKSAITGVLDSLGLKTFDWKKKESNAGKYVSHSFTVKITRGDQLEKLYILLNDLDVVKMLL